MIKIENKPYITGSKEELYNHSYEKCYICETRILNIESSDVIYAVPKGNHEWKNKILVCNFCSGMSTCREGVINPKETDPELHIKFSLKINGPKVDKEIRPQKGYFQIKVILEQPITYDKNTILIIKSALTEKEKIIRDKLRVNNREWKKQFELDPNSIISQAMEYLALNKALLNFMLRQNKSATAPPFDNEPITIKRSCLVENS